jgi:hypothetical protein
LCRNSVARTRKTLEHGGVPRQYSVWVWPNSASEAAPAGDAYLGDDPSARAAAYTGGNRTKPVPTHGPPKRTGEVAVVAEDAKRFGVGGTVQVMKVSHDEISYENGDGGDEEQLATRMVWEEGVDDEVGLYKFNGVVTLSLKAPAESWNLNSDFRVSKPCLLSNSTCAGTTRRRGKTRRDARGSKPCGRCSGSRKTATLTLPLSTARWGLGRGRGRASCRDR